MHIGLDLLFLNPGHTGGMEIVARSLLENIARIDRSNKYTLFVNRQGAASFDHLGDNFRECVLPIDANPSSLRSLFQQVVFPFYKEVARCDLLHSMGNISPLLAPTKRLVTIHDLIQFHESRDLTYLQDLSWRFLVKQAVRGAWIITVSENSRQDLIRCVGASPQKINVIPGACDEAFLRYDGSRDEQVRAQYNLPRRYLLFVGRMFHYKNVPVLLETFSKIQDSFPDLHLVLVGRPALGSAEIGVAIQRLGIGGKVLRLGFVAPEDLPAIYHQATVFVFPSLYEGFGLPVLEAMAAGVPVVCSNTSSIPEVAGEAALLANPHDPTSFAKAIRKLLTDQELYNLFSVRGKKRVARFSWVRAARDTLAVYEAITHRT